MNRQSHARARPMEPEAAVRTGAIMAWAMMMGVLAFSGVAALLVSNGSFAPNPGQQELMLGILAAVMLGTYLAAFMLSRVTVAARRREWQGSPQSEDARRALAPAYFVRTLLLAALVESSGLLGAVVLIVTGAWAALAAPALCVVALAFVAPTPARFDDYVQRVTGEAQGVR